MYSTSAIANVKGTTKRIVKYLMGRDHLLFSEISVNKEHLGTAYGGWRIATDYLPRNRVPLALTFGIGDDISFELELIHRYGAEVYAFDPTPMSMEWLAKNPEPPPQFHAFGMGVANFDGVQSFGRPTIAGALDFSARLADRDAAVCPVKKLSTIVQDYGLAHIDILKMDVEGSEYAVLEDLAHGDIRPTQMCIEFHHEMYGIRVSETTGAIRLLQSLGYRMFDVAPWGHEISLILKSAIG